MKTNVSDPWRGTLAETTVDNDDSPNDRFEDSFLDAKISHRTHRRLSDSEQYLQKLYSRLKVLQGGTTKKDLVTSLSVAKEDCIARLITSGNNPQSEEEAELASNPLIRHIAPHLQTYFKQPYRLSEKEILQRNCKRASRQQSSKQSIITSFLEALSGKVFLLVTGASRGIGRQIAITFGSLLEEGSRVLLLARNKDALRKVASNIPSKVEVYTSSTDLSKSTDVEFQEFLSEALKETTSDAFDRVVLVHNVGSLGDLSKSVNDMMDVNSWRELYHLNMFIPAILNAVVMNTFDNKTIKKTVINITSLYAIQAGIGSGQYSSVKAAREMYFKVFALENPDANVLSYSPGPVDTDMFTTVCETIADPEAKKMYIEMRQKKTVLTTEQTVNRLVQILKERKYNAADHVDYYDNLRGLPVSCVGTTLDNIARIIGRDMLPNIPRTIDKYICQDCHVKARTKALPNDDVTDTMATTASGNPKSYKYHAESSHHNIHSYISGVLFYGPTKPRACKQIPNSEITFKNNQEKQAMKLLLQLLSSTIILVIKM
ncbi:hypothetical protein DBV15_11901, partial [Temnothorax longispinosus]